MRRLKILATALIIGLLMPVLIPADPAAADATIGTLVVGGVARTYYVHVPAAYEDTRPAPLLIALHAAGSSGRAMAALTGLEAATDRAGFLAAFPNTAEAVWGEDATDPDGPDDVGFITALIDHLAETYAVDQERVYLVGFDNGGLMAYRLACQVPDRFHSVVVVGPLLWQRHVDACPDPPAAPVNVLLMYGTDDILYTPETHPYVSMFRRERPVILGADDTLDFWVARNECVEPISPAGVGQERAANPRVYDACGGGVRVALYRVVGGKQRTWPRTGDYALNRFGIDATAIIMGFLTGDDDWAVPQPEPLAEPARTYVAYVPSTYDPEVPLPLVITLHGRYGSGPGTAAFTGMNQVAEAHGFIALYPDGLVNPGAAYPYDTGWNYFRGVPYFPDEGPDDAAFLAALIDDLTLDLAIDRTRIYVNGFSNGGFMVHHLACHDPERYAGFATVAGSGYLGMAIGCQDSTPVPLLIIHGTQDNNVFWDGRTETISGQAVYTVWPVTEVIGFWAERNGCDLEDVRRMDIPPGGLSPATQVRVITFGGCPEDGEVALYGVIGGGHQWPGRPDGITGEFEADINRDINAGEVMWEFFSRQVRAGGE